MRLLLSTFVVLSVVATARSQCLSEDDSISNITIARDAYVRGAHDFSLRLFQSLYFGAETEQRNLFFSPHSLWSALTLAYIGAEGVTKEAMAEAMGVTNITKAEVVAAFRDITDKDRPAEGWQPGDPEERPNTLRVANRLYFDRTENIRECLKELLPGELELLDFLHASEEARLSINSWVETLTADRIQDLIPSGAVDARTRIVLANAAYFKGTWLSKFKPQDTGLELFYSSDKDFTFVNMMSQKGKFNFMVSEELQAHILELPYLGKNVTMYVLLPPFVDGALDHTVQKLTPENFQSAIRRMYPVEIRLKVPKFRVEENYEMSEKLSELGFENLFNASYSDLSGFSNSGGLALDAALHKSFLEINEEGAEAAAATALIINRSGRPKRPRQFICNHPFMYVIYDKETQSMLFMGTFEHPNAASLFLGKKV
ncbi:serpin B4-like [Amphibalanus amphitrite]|uniref:serpin B4-like n=1 Tax=Amphibalanus amphitrite TaxID=1232801 RepID=UPI001C902407|nr:serpin B4-like [Amphibalanus amphitrite]